jgi:hypothetical protein
MFSANFKLIVRNAIYLALILLPLKQLTSTYINLPKNSLFLSEDILVDHLRRFPEDLPSKAWYEKRIINGQKKYPDSNDQNFSWSPLKNEFNEGGISRFHIGVYKKEGKLYPAWGFVLFDYPIFNFANQYKVFLDLDAPIFRPYTYFNKFPYDEVPKLPSANILKMANISRIYLDNKSKKPSNLEELIHNGDIEFYKEIANQAEIYKVNDINNRLYKCNELKYIKEFPLIIDVVEEIKNPKICIIKDDIFINSSQKIKVSNEKENYRVKKIFGNIAIFEKINYMPMANKNLYLYTDVYDKNWNSYADNESLEIFNANFAFKAVNIPNNADIVWFEFRYTLFWIGILLSSISCTILLAYWIYKHNRASSKNKIF